MPDKIKAVGSKAEVYHETAKHTSGGLKKKDLMKTKAGRIVSRKKHAAGKKAIKHLRALGFIAKKGTFRLMRKSMAHSPKSKKSHRGRRTRRRGGYNEPAPTVADAASTAVTSAAGAVSNMMADKKY
jgi:hypothetical protein|uniref:Uncharacterized protein n=1 Tax=viral metagenome TaxID=1070528 RepID=A0A6C0BI95_9ZZZZ